MALELFWLIITMALELFWLIITMALELFCLYDIYGRLRTVLRPS
jgi:hypothetical protein